ncbi:hypothetical protein M885DRAFT_506093 [Pelagophyceae sp. CCMP2097]|nr:hypothetical protein M885DRAFT_506093 [Pelagophyceae sp. CCMP2097]
MLPDGMVSVTADFRRSLARAPDSFRETDSTREARWARDRLEKAEVEATVAHALELQQARLGLWAARERIDTTKEEAPPSDTIAMQRERLMRWADRVRLEAVFVAGAPKASVAVQRARIVDRAALALAHAAQAVAEFGETIASHAPERHKRRIFQTLSRRIFTAQRAAARADGELDREIDRDDSPPKTPPPPRRAPPLRRATSRQDSELAEQAAEPASPVLGAPPPAIATAVAIDVVTAVPSRAAPSRADECRRSALALLNATHVDSARAASDDRRETFPSAAHLAARPAAHLASRPPARPAAHMRWTAPPRRSTSGAGAAQTPAAPAASPRATTPLRPTSEKRRVPRPRIPDS